MTVGLVVVSHSDLLARGVAELASQMAPGARLAVSGGTDDGGIGTSLEATLAALTDADDGDGVVVLYDLGSAEMVAEAALEFLDDDLRARVRVVDAPLVTGALAAAVEAHGGGDLDEVAAAAARAGRSLALAPGEARSRPPEAEVEVVLPNPLGLHARPAALVVTAGRRFEADVRVEHVERGASASVRSLLGLVGLVASGGATLRLQAWGRDAAAAVEAIATLAGRGFGELGAGAVPRAAVAVAPPPPRAEAGVLLGVGVSGVVVVGPAAHLGGDDPAVPPGPAGDEAEERRGLERARSATRRELEALAGAPGGDIFGAQALLLDDPELLDATLERVAGGASAAAAWAAAVEEQRQVVAALPGEVFAARAADVADVGRRLLRHLTGARAVSYDAAALGGAIVVADDLLPSQVEPLRAAGVAGVALARGAVTAHSAILARNLDLPVVLGLGDGLLAIGEGTTMLLDAAAGRVVVDPPGAERRDAERRHERQAAARAAMLEAAQAPARLADGTAIVVAANASTALEARTAREHGAEGIGLLRTEVSFMDRPGVPGEDEQVEAIAGVCRALGAALVVVRTLDAGGDKPIPGLDLDPVRNGFLGVRGLRFSLANPALLHTQLRAILRVAADHRVAVMFPMVTLVEEVRAARAALSAARRSLEVDALRHGEPEQVGIMIEVPAAALAAQELAAEVDFFSIGSNDLAQYVLAADRTLGDVRDLYRPDHPSVLRLIEATCAGAGKHDRQVGVCGEIAGDPELAAVLVGLGVRELSMAPAAIPAVKRTLRELTLTQAIELARSRL